MIKAAAARRLARRAQRGARGAHGDQAEPAPTWSSPIRPATWPNGSGRPGDNRAVGRACSRRPSGSSPAASRVLCARCGRWGVSTPCSSPAVRAAWVFDVDGNRYVDWVLSWGPLIAGHAHPHVVEAVTRAAADGSAPSARPPRSSCGSPSSWWRPCRRSRWCGSCPPAPRPP